MNENAVVGLSVAAGILLAGMVILGKHQLNKPNSQEEESSFPPVISSSVFKPPLPEFELVNNSSIKSRNTETTFKRTGLNNLWKSSQMTYSFELHELEGTDKIRMPSLYVDDSEIKLPKKVYPNSGSPDFLLYDGEYFYNPNSEKKYILQIFQEANGGRKRSNKYRRRRKY